ncbi:hypothetical protein TNCT_435031 [Trichonephila clavata]|uniref:Uncharacterized protein n=1 Tax=Trichonephila clavata TaxID=2740835 RepID=A0A8X6ICB0_TRICU|nr:hypothetical protein TNCT_435031 [Trichonephila clavata]
MVENRTPGRHCRMRHHNMLGAVNIRLHPQVAKWVWDDQEVEEVRRSAYIAAKSCRFYCGFFHDKIRFRMVNFSTTIFRRFEELNLQSEHPFRVLHLKPNY